MTTTTSAKPLIDPIALLIAGVIGFAVILPTICLLGVSLIVLIGVGSSSGTSGTPVTVVLTIMAILLLVIILEAVAAAASYGFFYKRRHGEISTSRSMIGGAVTINILIIFVDACSIWYLPNYFMTLEESDPMNNLITLLATLIGVMVVAHVIAGVLGTLGGAIYGAMAGKPAKSEPAEM